MQLVLSENTEIRFKRKNMIALGAFDGFHIGHMALVDRIKEKAEEKGCASMIFSFQNHPLTVLNPQKAPLPIMTYEEKLEICSSLGIDYLVLLPFSAAFSRIDPEQFLRMLETQYHAGGIVTGFNFRFGNKGTGDIETIRSYCTRQGMEADVIERVCFEEETVSSSRIRELITSGRIDVANGMLGRPYSIESAVLQGRKLGRTMGFRTANIAPNGKVLPAVGVYVTRARIEGEVYQAITNIGYNPTVSDSGAISIETHLLDCDRDIYDKLIKIEFLHRIRDERKFDSMEELKTQIAQDVHTAREYLSMVK